MVLYIVKICITVMLVVLITEIAKRSAFFGALFASVPLVSVLAMTWLYVDTKDASKVSVFSTSVFWLVLPSLVLFMSLPFLLKMGLNFYASLGLSVVATVISYRFVIYALKYYGVEL